jgi:hypothetical protein
MRLAVAGGVLAALVTLGLILFAEASVGVAWAISDQLALAAVIVAFITFVVALAALIAAILAARYAYDQLALLRSDQQRIAGW